jgi:arabinofuranan 3-O-arabinosyltransferase
VPSTSRGERATLVGAGTVLVVLVLANDWGVLTPDTKPEVFLAPWRTLVHTAAVWQDSPFLGAPNFNVGLVPVTAVTGVLAGAGLPAWLVLRVWRIALLLIAAAGCRRLYVDLVAGTPADTATGRVAAAVAFVVNPYLLLGGATTPTLLPFALLPWFLLALRRGFATPRSWRPPAVAALLFAAMGGINAGVVPLIQLVAVGPLVADARRREGRPWRDLLTVLGRTAPLMALLSLYWLVPALSAVSVGAAIAGSTESNAAIAATSSWSEVLRGLGLWTLYGADAAGPFQPGLLAYLGSPLVVAATFALPVVAAAGAVLSRSPVRRPAVAWLATAAVVMVGLHPPDSSTPFGRLLEAAFEHVPGAVAFRTTNKAGAVLVLGVALLTALGAAAVAPRLRTPGRRSAAAVAVVTLAVGVTAPAWTGDLFGTRVPLPAYWRDAASAVDAAAGSTAPVGTAVGRGRVLFAPGSALTRYRWGYVGPDELGNALLERPTTYRSAVPAGTPAAANLLAGTDTRLQEGTLPRGALSTLARYAGATEVLLRDDKVWELDEGARPAEVSAAAAADPGLRPLRSFGRPGENTVGPRGPGAGDDRVPPLEWFAVTGAQGPVRQVPASGAVVVDGDGEALPDLVGQGLLAGDPALLYAGSLDAEALGRVLRLGSRVVLTDTNRRAGWNPGRVAGGTGPLLPAEASPGSTRALFGPDDQTVAVAEGTARVTASGGGLVFGPLPYGDASLAVDGDPTTAWLTGNFEGGVGDALTLTTDRPVDVPVVTLRLPSSAGRHVTRVRVVVSGGGATAVTAEQDLPVATAEPVVVRVPGGRGTSVRVEIAAVAGQGFGPVGIAEVAVPGLASTKVARLPTGLARRVAAAGAEAGAALDRTPVDVLLRRRLGNPRTGIDDEEPRLARDLTLPAARRYALSGHLRVSGTASDALLARLLGRRGTITATASSRAFNDPAARATSAIDGTARGRPSWPRRGVPPTRSSASGSRCASRRGGWTA